MARLCVLFVALFLAVAAVEKACENGECDAEEASGVSMIQRNTVKQKEAVAKTAETHEDEPTSTVGAPIANENEDGEPEEQLIADIKLNSERHHKGDSMIQRNTPILMHRDYPEGAPDCAAR